MKKRIKRSPCEILVVLPLLVVANFAFGQTPIPWNQKFGDFSLSSGFNYSQQSRNSLISSNTETVPTAFGLVLTHRVSIQAAPSIFKASQKAGSLRNDGFGDTTFGASIYLTHPDASHYFAAVLGYTVKVPTSNPLVSASRELDHVVTINLQGIPGGAKSARKLTLQVEPGIGCFGKNSGGDLTKAVLSIRESFLLNPQGAVSGNKWTFKNETACYSAASNSPTDCSDTMRVSHTWRLPSGRIELVGGPRVGLTPFTSRVGVVVSLAWGGSIRR